MKNHKVANIDENYDKKKNTNLHTLFNFLKTNILLVKIVMI